jgi:hypothetical protein
MRATGCSCAERRVLDIDVPRCATIHNLLEDPHRRARARLRPLQFCYKTKNGRSENGRKLLKRFVGAAGFEPAAPCAQGTADNHEKPAVSFRAGFRSLLGLVGHCGPMGPGVATNPLRAVERTGRLRAAAMSAGAPPVPTAAAPTRRDAAGRPQGDSRRRVKSVISPSRHQEIPYGRWAGESRTGTDNRSM